jgi:hypothetical protein
VPSYEIMVIGSLGPAAGQAFADLAVEAGPAVTVVSGDLDRRGLQVLLNRMHAMGLELVAIRRKPRALLPLGPAPVRHARQLEQFEAEREDAVQRAVEGGLVEVGDQGGVRAVRFDPEVAEGFAADVTQITGYRDPITVRTHVTSDISDWHRNYICRYESVARSSAGMPKRYNGHICPAVTK